MLSIEHVAGVEANQAHVHQSLSRREQVVRDQLLAEAPVAAVLAGAESAMTRGRGTWGCGPRRRLGRGRRGPAYGAGRRRRRWAPAAAPAAPVAGPRGGRSLSQNHPDEQKGGSGYSFSAAASRTYVECESRKHGLVKKRREKGDASSVISEPIGVRGSSRPARSARPGPAAR